MDREILFRGKRMDNGKWVEGWYCPKKTGHYEGDSFVEEMQSVIIASMTGGGYQYAVVDPRTVCQYTGLTDRNGKKIFVGDIVEDKHGNLYKAFWQENYYQFSFICIKSKNNFLKDAKWALWSLSKNDELSFCGNIFDNPALLEGGAE